jgi:hypothetical protein
MPESFHLAHANIARWRFGLLWEQGSTSEAFTFRNRFEAGA